jgi:hypothetical protein
LVQDVGLRCVAESVKLSSGKPEFGASMANEHSELAAAASLLVDEMEGELGDRHEIWLRLQTILQQIRATGMPVPDDLVRMERLLEEEFDSETKA